MTKLGLIARCDQGGLATQTWEAYRHLRPHRTLVVDFGELRGRGSAVPGMYGPHLSSRGAPNDDVITEFLEGLDVVFTCETVYTPRLCEFAMAARVEVVVQVNPELYQPAEYPGARIVVPTEWMHDQMPEAELLPVPVNRQVLPFRRRTKLEVLYHPASPAMMDRNGTEAVLACLQAVRHPMRLIVRGRTDTEGKVQVGPVTVEWLPNEARPYYELYPELDVLLLPRRYGGLCLPMQEAASLGAPALMLKTDPMASLGHVFSVPTMGADLTAMKGGSFEVHQVDPWTLAQAINELAELDLSRQSDAAGRWAAEHSWEALRPEYERVLGA